ncbi:hypothetical protein D3C84_855960 [compost metagenome]
MRPPMIVVLIISASPPQRQLLSARFGKPKAPLASEPWHTEQLEANRRPPIFSACGSFATSSTGMAANLAKIGPNFASALAISFSHSWAPVQPFS